MLNHIEAFAQSEGFNKNHKTIKIYFFYYLFVHVLKLIIRFGLST